MAKSNSMKKVLKDSEIEGTEKSKEAKFRTRKPGRPSKASIELAKTFDIGDDDIWVKNTIEDVFEQNIDSIINLLQSIKKFGDPNVYETLPSELNERLSTYGQAIQEYYSQFSSTINNREVVVMPDSYEKCRMCHKYKSKNTFTKFTDSETGQEICSLICKDCANQILLNHYKKTNDLLESVMITCQKADILLLKEAVELLQKSIDGDTNLGFVEIKESSYFSEYVRILNNYFHNQSIPIKERTFEYTNFGGIPFKTIQRTFVCNSIYNDKFEIIGDDDTSDEIEELNNNKKKLKKLRNKWGNFPPEDLLYLENAWNQWYETSEVPTGRSGETMVNQLCYMELDIYKKQMNGDDIAKIAGNYRKYLKDCGITGKKKKVKTDEDLGSMIKKWESIYPIRDIVEIDPKYKDIDGIDRITNAFIANIKRTQRLQDKSIQKFEEDYKDYSVDFEKIANEKSES